jgi:Sensors of blue-light using FAD
MRQILYISTSTAGSAETDLNYILQQSRHNNAIDGITGLLWADGKRFMQVFEGPGVSVALTWERIQADDRHHEIAVLQDRLIPAREFGYWSMAYRRADETEDEYEMKVRRLIAYASPEIRDGFEGMMRGENS